MTLSSLPVWTLCHFILFANLHTYTAGSTRWQSSSLMMRSGKVSSTPTRAQLAVGWPHGKSNLWTAQSFCSCCVADWTMISSALQWNFDRLGNIHKLILRKIAYDNILQPCRPTVIFISVWFGHHFVLQVWWGALCCAKEGLQRICGSFLACLGQFRSSYPAKFVEEEECNLYKSCLSLIRHIQLLLACFHHHHDNKCAS